MNTKLLHYCHKQKNIFVYNPSYILSKPGVTTLCYDSR